MKLDIERYSRIFIMAGITDSTIVLSSAERAILGAALDLSIKSVNRYIVTEKNAEIRALREVELQAIQNMRMRIFQP